MSTVYTNSSRRQIAFDLSQSALKKNYPHSISAFSNKFYKKAYADIARFMKQNRFWHRQYSVYVSLDRLTNAKVAALMTLMSRKFPWFMKCVEQIDVTNIGSQHSLLSVISDTDSLTSAVYHERILK